MSTERNDMTTEMLKLADQLEAMAKDRQAWAESPEIGGKKPRFAEHLKGKRYGYSHAAQLIRSRVKLSPAGDPS